MRTYRFLLFGAVTLFLLTGNSACLPGDISTASHADSVPSGRNSDPDWAAAIGSVASETQTYLPYLVKADQLGSSYPRLAYMWGTSESVSGAGFFAGYDLFIPYELRDPGEQMATIRKANPGTRILLTLGATYAWPGLDPLATEWWNSKPGDPGYNCLLRDSHGVILLVKYWGHPIFNMTVPYCRQLIIERNIAGFQSQQSGDGAPLYDGLFWDLLHGTISWLSDDIDSNLDGRPDNPDTTDAAYRAGVEDFLVQVRSAFPSAIFVGNEATQDYDRWINGRLFEWQLSALLDGNESFTWDDTINDYNDWTRTGHSPRMTFIATRPEAIYEEKHPFQSPPELPVAMQMEAVSSYQRMRYGLTTALMGDGLFWYDTRIEISGVWWYDEFGAPVGEPASTLPPRGYLGWPTGEPRLLVNRLETPDQVMNGGFEDGLAGWWPWVNEEAGAAATIDVEPTSGISGTAAVHVSVANPAEPWDVQLQQFEKTTVAGTSYTLSFWARSEVTRTLSARIAQHAPPGTDYGFSVHTTVTPQWQHFHLTDVPSVTANDGEIELHLGVDAGELWLDDIQFQAGAIGVWARPFQKGLAVINTTKSMQSVPLPGIFCKLKGNQAPLFQVRVDDEEAAASAGWDTLDATVDQFGKIVWVASGGTGVTMTYSPALAHQGTYEVLTWVAPNAAQSSAVSVTIRHAQGEAAVLLDEATGDIGWRSLGKYTFDIGRTGSATLAATGSGSVVADAFKWVSTARYNDGSQVSWLTLEPQDGMILLSSCTTPN